MNDFIHFMQMNKIIIFIQYFIYFKNYMNNFIHFFVRRLAFRRSVMQCEWNWHRLHRTRHTHGHAQRQTETERFTVVPPPAVCFTPVQTYRDNRPQILVSTTVQCHVILHRIGDGLQLKTAF